MRLTNYHYGGDEVFESVLRDIKRILATQEKILGLLVSHEERINVLEKEQSEQGEVEIDLPDTFVNN